MPAKITHTSASILEFDQATLKQLLTKRHWFRFPHDLEQQFFQAYEKQAIEAFRTNTLYIMALYLSVGIIGLYFIDVDQLAVIKLGYLLVFFCILLWVILARIPMLEPYHQTYTGTIAFCILTIAMIDTLLLAEGIMRQLNISLTIYSVIVIYSLGWLRLQYVIFCSWSSGIGALVWAYSGGFAVNWLEYFQYMIGANLVGMAMGYAALQRERLAFLQARLLALEAKQLKYLSDELNRIARIDTLTQLANRRHFDEELQRYWHYAHQHKNSIALLFIDVDYFKLYNDYYGHIKGDACLSKVAEILGHTARRSNGLAARYGGEEFVIVYNNITLDTLKQWAKRLLMNINRLSLSHAQSPIATHITVSIGGALVCALGQDNKASGQGRVSCEDDLIQTADKALYQAKQAGRNRFVIAR